jgi:hypothetical protein
MLRRTLFKRLFYLQFSLFAVSNSQAQFISNINWDNLDYLVTTGTYSPFVTPAMAFTQNFSIGTNRLTIAVPNTGVTLNGENITHTGEAGSYGVGADVSYTTTIAARTITLTFDTEVSTFKMSVYDLDLLQRITVSATNALGVPQLVALTKPALGTVVIAGSPGLAPTGTGNAANYANNVTTGTLNIDIAGPVKTITLAFSNAVGDFWFSDISASVATTFPATYFLVSKPFTGMPGYVLVVVDNKIYYTNPANGVSKFLFTDVGHTNLNSLAYDPVNRFVYYCYTLSGAGATANPNNKALKKYDVNTGIISTIIPDITTLGIPVFESGIEVGAGAFYNGSMYLGIEAYSTGVATGRKSTVWRIDFNGSNVPYRACQVYGSNADAGTTLIHDWGDIGFSNGILYDFDAAAGGNDDYYHFNMLTGVAAQFNPVGVSPSQTAVGWNEQLYNVNSNIMAYNNNGTVGTSYAITSTPAITGVRWGDAGEAFRPFLDFGDAPATYDPAAGDPAVHDTSYTALRIGANTSIEWLKRGTTSAEDTYEDGIGTISFLLPGTGNYLVQVSVLNNTGSNATLCAWLDYNGNGVFDPSEGISQTVATSGTAQSKYLSWPGVTTPLLAGSYTYLRVRLTSTSNGMTTANPTGFYPNGEVEDYRVPVDLYPLAATLISFDAKKTNDNKVRLSWSANEETSFIAYEVQRSRDGIDWNTIGFVSGSQINGLRSYTFMDDQPYKGVSYYRLSLGEGTGGNKYSAVRSVTINDFFSSVSIAPNPAINHTTITIVNSSVQVTALIKVLNMHGNELYSQKTIIRPGDNPVNLPIQDSWPSGMYMVQVTSNGETTNKKILIRR